MRKLKTALLLAGGVVLVGGGVALLFALPAQAQGQTSTALASSSCDCQETSFGDLVADAVRDAAGADIGLVGAISFKPGSLGPGPLTRGRVASLLANPEEVWAVSQLTGKQIRGALEHAVHSSPLPSSSFLQVSGLNFQYSLSAPRGERVRSVQVGFAPLNDTAKYTVAMPLSLAKGGSGFFKFFTIAAVQRRGTTGLAATVVAYAQKQGTVSYSGVGRITALP